MKTSWRKFLECMLVDYRSKHPDCDKGDIELVVEFHEYLYEHGNIKKTKKGKYIIPDKVENWFIQ